MPVRSGKDEGAKIMVGTVHSSWWQPSCDTLDTIAAVLTEHWRAATAPQRLFWPHPGEWLLSPELTPVPAAGSTARLAGWHP
jgi:hypothetical protein